MDDVAFSDFTNEEKERINELYASDFQGEMTPDDVALIAKWERCKAISNERYLAEVEAMQQETMSKIEQSTELANVALQNLEDLKNAAMARLERLNDGN